jgi:hypothetical protein
VDGTGEWAEQVNDGIGLYWDWDWDWDWSSGLVWFACLFLWARWLEVICLHGFLMWIDGGRMGGQAAACIPGYYFGIFTARGVSPAATYCILSRCKQEIDASCETARRNSSSSLSSCAALYCS